MIPTNVSVEIKERCSRRRGLLEACVESTGRRTFTDDEIEEEVADFRAALLERAGRGVELIPRHE